MLSPPPLIPGDTIGIVATARPLLEKEVRLGIEWMEAKGFKVELSASVGRQHHRFAGTDTFRLQELQAMLDNPLIKAIWCARGGYGTLRIVDELQWSGFLQHPKWIIGFSDLTALHAAIQRHGYTSIHGMMPYNIARSANKDSFQSLIAALTGQPQPIIAKEHPNNRIGDATGVLVGGNLALFHHLIGTPDDVDTTGKLLLIEDTSEQLYSIDRMMIHLKRSGKLSRLAGLVVGDFSLVQDDQPPFGQDYMALIASHVAAYSYPVAFQLPIGHEPVNHAVVLGKTYSLSVGNLGTVLRPNQ